MSRRRQQTEPEREAWTPVAACGNRVGASRSGAAQDTPGVWRRARGESSTRNRRDPTWLLTSSEGGVYKPKAKGHRAGRESEGPVVPSMPVTRTPAEGRGPTLVASGEGGKCEGMTARSNNPIDKARELRSRLFVTDKRCLPGVYAPLFHPLPAMTDWRGEGASSGQLRECGMRKPSVSRVRENRTHCLTGGHRSPGPQGYRA